MALLFVFFVCYAFVIYLTGLIGISLLMVLMPIFFLGILFSFFKQSFESWCTQIISFMMQSIMLFSLLALFSALILNSYYRTLGFTTCYNDFLNFTFSIGGLKISDISTWRSWAPGQEYTPMSIGFLGNYNLIPGFKFTQGKAIISIPPDYKEKGCRYLDYPYFDPGYSDEDCKKMDYNVDCKSDADKTLPKCQKPTAEYSKGSGYDYDIIINFINKQHLIIFSEVFATLLIVVVMYHIRLFVQNLGAAIAGASPFTTVVGLAYEAPGGIGNFINNLLAGVRVQVTQGIASKIDGGISSLTKRAGIDDSRLLKGIKGVSSKVGSFVNASEWLLGTESQQKRYYREKDAFKEIDYARAVIGSNLPSAESPLHASAFLAKHVLQHSILGIKEDNLLTSIKKVHANRMEKLRSTILGYQRPGPQKDDNKKTIDENENPFDKSNGEISRDSNKGDLMNNLTAMLTPSNSQDIEKMQDFLKNAKLDKDGKVILESVEDTQNFLIMRDAFKKHMEQQDDLQKRQDFQNNLA